MMTRLRPSDSVRFFMAAPCFVSRLGACLSLLHQSLVKADSLLGDGCPAKGFFDAASSCIAEALAFLRIADQPIDGSGEIAREFLRISGKACDRVLIKRH